MYTLQIGGVIYIADAIFFGDVIYFGDTIYFGNAILTKKKLLNVDTQDNTHINYFCTRNLVKFIIGKASQNCSKLIFENDKSSQHITG